AVVEIGRVAGDYAIDLLRVPGAEELLRNREHLLTIHCYLRRGVVGLSRAACRSAYAQVCMSMRCTSSDIGTPASTSVRRAAVGRSTKAKRTARNWAAPGPARRAAYL